jgi:hypothetical protein
VSECPIHSETYGYVVIGGVKHPYCSSCWRDSGAINSIPYDAAAAARRERVRKAIERALGEMYPSFASHRIASGIVTDAALAAMDSDGGVE